MTMFWVVCGLIGRYQRFRAEDGDSMFLGNVGTYLPTSLHGVTTQKNVAILTAVRTSYLTSLNELRINICQYCVRFQVLTAASMKFRIVFWDVLPCKMIVDRLFRSTCWFHHQGWWRPRTSETSVDNYFTRQYIPEDNSELYASTVRSSDALFVCLCLSLCVCVCACVRVR
jgi:hypothetical protein